MDSRDLPERSKTAIPEIWVVKTKLTPLTLPNGIIDRDHLIRKLHKSVITTPVTIISAPAGYGKTTLLTSLCIIHDELSIAWLSLDDDDNDTFRFLFGLIASLQDAVPNCATTTQNLLTSLQNPANEIHRLVGVLINDVIKMERNPLILILDDLHVIRNPIVLETLDYLIEYLPENLHLVIATRHDPSLSLPRLRAGGRLTEFRLTNLRFSLSEVNQYMNQQLGLELSPESITALESRTEGWAAVLRLLATSLGRIVDPSERHVFVNRLPLKESYIFDFLAAEILNQQEPQHKYFLLTTSILPELNASLCQAVTEQQNAAEMLDDLFQNNLVQIMTQPTTDGSSPSYRYHELLADFLSRQLEREFTSEEIDQLHNRAAKAQPGTPSSINHYLKAKRWDKAAETIQQIGQQMIFMGLHDTIQTWITALPQHTINRYPQLDYFLGLSAFQRGGLDEAQKLITRALEGYETSGDEIKMGEAILILGAIASGFHDVDRGRQLLEQALTYPLTTHLKIMAHINYAWIGIYSNDWELVEKNLTTAMSMALKLEESDAFNILAPHLTAVLLFIPNGVSYFKEYCTKVLAWFGDEVGLVQIGANSLMGVIHLMEGELQMGRVELEQARKASNQLGGFVWLDIGIDFGLLQHALIQADYNRFEVYWQSRLSHYEQVSGAREYLASFLYIQGRAFWYQNRIKEAQEIYKRMLAIESPQDIPESHLARALMGAILMINQKQYFQAERVLQQVTKQNKRAPHSVLLGNARPLLASLYLKMNQREDAIAELRMLIADFERKDMLGLLLTEGPDIIPVLKYAIEKDVCVEQVNWLLGKLRKDGKFQPILISTTGETLTQREMEVLHLITEGKTNREIAEHLFISETTVKSHTTSIFRRLDVRSRTQAAVQARLLNLF